MLLYGQWLWRDGGKMVVVTEGELDCLSVSMIQQNKWPTVSVKNGAQGASVTRNLLNGLRALRQWCSCSTWMKLGSLPPEPVPLYYAGQGEVHSYLKDANEMLMANRGKRLSAIWEAKTFRPTVSCPALTFGLPCPPTRLSTLWTTLRWPQRQDARPSQVRANHHCRVWYW